MMDKAIVKLKIQRSRLLEKLPEVCGSGFLEQNTRVFDRYFQNSMNESVVCSQFQTAKKLFSVVALGGYGRQEQCLHSDIDVLFLFHGSVPVEAEQMFRDIIYPLWDLRFEVGHATRSLKDCIALASEDFQILTSLLDARLLCGSKELFSTMVASLDKKVVQKKKKQIISWLADSNRERHDLFGDATYLLEPNVKEGMGGLRDYHSMLWMARVAFGSEGQIEPGNLFQIPEKEYQEFGSALSYIWRVRNKIHHLSGRKCDRLYFEFHQELANHFKQRENSNLHPVEQFLGEFHKQVEVIKHQYLLFQAELTREKGLWFVNRFFGKQTKEHGLTIQKNMLDFVSLSDCMENPALLIKIFVESIALQIPISSEAKRVERELSRLIDQQFRASRAIVDAFEETLDRYDGENNVLDEMLCTGFLTSFIPAFREVVNRIEYDEYHVYPVDKHLLLTLRTVNDLGREEAGEDVNLYSQLYHEVKDKKILQWAALLHDIGKGDICADHSQKGAAISESILSECGYGEEEIALVSFLIKEHLLLRKTATRRDLNDEQTAISCAEVIKDSDRLKMLYLLTVADCMATGSKAWTDWTATLVRDLFFRVLHVLENGELASAQSVEIIQTKKETILANTLLQDQTGEMASWVKHLSPRYLLAVSEKDIQHHLQLSKNLGDKPFVWHVAREQGAATRTVTICAQNHPGLFAKIAGILSVYNLDILDVQAFTWRNGIALDIFQVTAPRDQLFEEKTWMRVEKSLEDALAGVFDIAEAVYRKSQNESTAFSVPPQKSSRVTIDDQTSSYFTILEVHAYDYPGLLFRMSDAIFSHGYDIFICKAATKVDQVVDSFYIRDFNGQKSGTSQKSVQLKKAIEEIVRKPVYHKEEKK